VIIQQRRQQKSARNAPLALSARAGRAIVAAPSERLKVCEPTPCLM